MLQLHDAATTTRTPIPRAQWPFVLSFEAPYLIRKLLLQKIVASEAEALALFDEVKRYLLLVDADPARAYPMTSLRVDEAWHQFVLFTIEYTDFCQRGFGRYMHHSPSNAPDMEAVLGGRQEATREELAATYRSLFGMDLPAVWDDATSVTLDRRLLRNRERGTHAVRVENGRAELVFVAEDDAQPIVLARIDAWGAPALWLIAHRPAFFVRELPGPLAAEDKIALCRALVRSDTLRVAP
jgi:hypothetical protein